MVAVGILTAAIGLLDWLLTARQKLAVERQVYAMWLWLSDQRKVKPVDYLRRLYRPICFCLPLAMALLAALSLPFGVVGRILGAVVTFLGYVLILGYHCNQVLEEKFLAASSLASAIAEVFKAVGRSLPLAFILLVYGFFVRATLGDAPLLANAGTAMVRFGVSLIIVPLWVLPLSMCAVLSIHFAGFCFVSTEFLVRRALEQEKGVLPAVAAVSSSIGLLIKSLL